MQRRPCHKINPCSATDIAFFLIIFFVLITNINTDSGITRKLSYASERDYWRGGCGGNVLVVLINKHNQLAVQSRLVTLEGLHDKVKEFLTNPLRLIHLPKTKLKNIPLSGGEVEVSKGIISLQNDRGTKFERYIVVQNEIMKAINELRDEKSVAEFGCKYKKLPADKQKAIAMFYPYAISEAEPMEIQ